MSAKNWWETDEELGTGRYYEGTYPEVIRVFRIGDVAYKAFLWKNNTEADDPPTERIYRGTSFKKACQQALADRKALTRG